MIRIGIVGLGFMGRMHLRCVRTLKGIEPVAVCDVEPGRIGYEGHDGVRDGGSGNIAGADGRPDFTGIDVYTDFDSMLSETKLDAVSITLPTYLHADYSVRALQAGLHVLCEKPMALSLDECRRMIETADATNRILQVGHCIRFWPEYVESKEIIDTGKYGRVKAASFRRLSMTPGWSWKSWIIDHAKSGGAMMDLHIHDADFVQYLFGLPRAVFCSAVRGPSGDYDHCVTNYMYDDEQVITAEGGWIMTDGFGFEMSFNIVLEQAVIQYDSTRDPAFRICPADGDSYTPEIANGDGYSHEITHFRDRILGTTTKDILTPRQSADSVALVLAEKQSADQGKVIPCRGTWT